MGNVLNCCLTSMLQTKAEIIENRELLSGTYYQLSLKAERIARVSKPGQFLHIKVNQGISPLLRRPFSIHRVRKQNLDILYKVKGRGTEILSQRKRGQYLDIIGPLGKGYKLPAKGAKIILVAGGIGIASLYFLAEKIAPPPKPGGCTPASGEGEREGGLVVLIGGKSKEDILCEDKFKRLGGEVKISTEDGSLGRKGLVTDLLEEEILQLTLQSDFVAFNSKPSTVLYACGPMEMLKEIAKIARSRRIFCQVSLEEHLACGVGACQGCVIRVKGERYKRVCKDGPVFNSKEIAW